MTIYIVDLEAVDTRYTQRVEKILLANQKRHTNSKIEVISGGNTPKQQRPGAFLNFGGTNVYKAKQMQQIGELFCNGKIKDGDYFPYTQMHGILQCYNYVTWQSYLVLIFHWRFVARRQL